MSNVAVFSSQADSSKSNAIPEDEEGSLVKQSCHDSGIDIREPNPPLPVVQPIVAKKVYSDADIVLSSDWVPPITIAPTNVTTSTLDADSVINGRKKASSVSFSLDSNNEEPEKEEDHREDDKQETRKNKVRGLPLPRVFHRVAGGNVALELWKQGDFEHF